MQAIGLTFVDWLIIAIYFAFVLGHRLLPQAVHQEPRRTSSWPAARTAPGWPGWPSSRPTSGALELLGMTGNTFKYGMYVAHFYWIGAIPAMLFLGIYMMPFYYSSRIKSDPGLPQAPVRREDARAQRHRLRAS